MMHVSWTTLREQIFTKLRRPYRSEANMNEVGHVLNAIAFSYHQGKRTVNLIREFWDTLYN
jgi:hypothetical protein